MARAAQVTIASYALLPPGQTQEQEKTHGFVASDDRPQSRLWSGRADKAVFGAYSNLLPWHVSLARANTRMGACIELRFTVGAP
jgi:hypothetical protein